MKKICPRCKSPQNFAIQNVILEDDICEVFIRCSVCRWKHVVRRDNAAKIHDIKEIKKLKIRAKKSPGLKDVIRRKKQKYE